MHSPPYAIQALLAVARRRILQVARTDSCILSTRVAVGVLRRLGFSARPIATRLMVLNPAIYARLHIHAAKFGGFPPPERIFAWQMEEDSDCWSVGVGYGDPRPGAYAGHLVAMVNDDQWIVDLAIDQAHRPERGLEVPSPVAVATTFGFRAGTERLVHLTASGCCLVYEQHNDQSWQRSPDWNLRRHSAPLIAQITSLINAAIAGKGATA